MEIDDLHELMKEQHKTTVDKLTTIETDVVEVGKSIVRIESTMQTKNGCEEKRGEVYKEVDKAKNWTKILALIGGGLAIVITALVALLKTGVV